MSLTKICCICGIRKDSRKSKEKNSRVFFYFPNRDRKDKGVSGQYAQKLLETRLAAWKNVVGSNLEKYKTGVACVCSDHFHSGKPSHLYHEHDPDWVPSKNLTNSDKQEEHCVNSDDLPSNSSQTHSSLPMVTFINPELLLDSSFSNNPSTAVQCALDDHTYTTTVKQEIMDIQDEDSITIKQEIIMDIEDFSDEVPLNIDPNLIHSSNSTSTADLDFGTQVDFDEPPLPIQLDKSTQAENIDPNLIHSSNSTSTADFGTQVEFDEPPLPIQLDKSTQTEMSSFPKSREILKSIKI